MQTIIARSLHSLKKNLNQARKSRKIGLVPTMGSLHDGHLALIKKSRKLKFFTIVTIFVNPLQFNNKGDLKKYPLQEKKDIDVLKKNNVDLVFIPKFNFNLFSLPSVNDVCLKNEVFPYREFF